MDIDKEEVIIPEIVNPGGGSGRPKDQGLKKARLGCAISGFSYFLMIALGAIIYVWTIIIAYQSAGFLAAFLSLLFPVFAQIFWGIQLWINRGIANPYCLTLLGYLLTTILLRAGILLFQNSMNRFER